MSEQSAIRLLQTAIQNVRDTCTGPDCKPLLAAIDAADSQAEKYLGVPDDSAEDKKTEQPRDLKGAAKKARQIAREYRENK